MEKVSLFSGNIFPFSFVVVSLSKGEKFPFEVIFVFSPGTEKRERNNFEEVFHLREWTFQPSNVPALPRFIDEILTFRKGEGLSAWKTSKDIYTRF